MNSSVLKMLLLLLCNTFEAAQNKYDDVVYVGETRFQNPHGFVIVKLPRGDFASLAHSERVDKNATVPLL